jgi:hypothetical protein
MLWLASDLLHCPQTGKLALAERSLMRVGTTRISRINCYCAVAVAAIFQKLSILIFFAERLARPDAPESGLPKSIQGTKPNFRQVAAPTTR